MQSEQPFMIWYESLVKPSWTPSPSVIGGIWTVLYPIIITVFAICLYRILKQGYSTTLGLVIAINILSNALFTYFQFGLRNNPLALLDIAVVLLSTLVIIVMLWTPWRVGSYLLLPYALWVGIASVLQTSITLKNW